MSGRLPGWRGGFSLPGKTSSCTRLSNSKVTEEIRLPVFRKLSDILYKWRLSRMGGRGPKDLPRQSPEARRARREQVQGALCSAARPRPPRRPLGLQRSAQAGPSGMRGHLAPRDVGVRPQRFVQKQEMKSSLWDQNKPDRPRAHEYSAGHFRSATPPMPRPRLPRTETAHASPALSSKARAAVFACLGSRRVVMASSAASSVRPPRPKKEPQALVIPKNAAEEQKLKLERLMKNPVRRSAGSTARPRPTPLRSGPSGGPRAPIPRHQTQDLGTLTPEQSLGRARLSRRWRASVCPCVRNLYLKAPRGLRSFRFTVG